MIEVLALVFMLDGSVMEKPLAQWLPTTADYLPAATALCGLKAKSYERPNFGRGRHYTGLMCRIQPHQDGVPTYRITSKIMDFEVPKVLSGEMALPTSRLIEED